MTDAKTSPAPVFAAIDVGSGVTKALAAGNETVYTVPSVVGEVSETMPTFGTSEAVAPFGTNRVELVRFSGLAFAVGSDAEALVPPDGRSDTLSSDWACSPGWKALLYHAIAALVPEQGPYTFTLELGTGLPQALFESQRVEVETWLTETRHRFSVGERDFDITIKPTLAPQVMGALLHQARTQPSLLDMYAAAIDIGTYTTGYGVLAHGRPQNWRCGGEALGVAHIIEEVGRYVQGEYGFSPDPASLVNVVRDKRVYIHGEAMNLEGVINNIATRVAAPVVKVLQRTWSNNAGDLSVWLAGGGAPVFKDAIQKVIPHAKLCQDPEFAVVRGYLDYVLSRST